MSEPMSRLSSAREHVDPHWDDARAMQELHKLEARIAARKRKQWIGYGAGLAFASALLIGVLARRDVDETQPEVVATAPRLEGMSGDKLSAQAAPTTVQGEPQAEPAAPEMARAVAEERDAAAAEPSGPSGPRSGLSRRVVVLGSSEWRKLAEAGRYKEAFAALPSQSLKPAGLDVPGLLLAADSARLSGHPREAVPYYREIFEQNPRDSRAHLAAFTLGRTLLYELSDPRGAAAAFAKAYELSPKSPLAEEALAREVESLAKVGDLARAKQRAEVYFAAFPKGRRSLEVKRTAGLP